MNTETNPVTVVPANPVSEYRIPRVGILAFYLGWLGVHRFYTGRTILGILQLITLGGCGFWALADLILALFGKLKDDKGLYITQWDHEPSASDKRLLPAFLLCTFVGALGIHRFYAGKIGTGILQLVTCGGFGIWYVIDHIMLAWGRFTDSKGHIISRWT